MRWQIGQFFLFVGLLVLMIFLITDWAGSPGYAYLCSGIAGLLLGISLMWLGRNPAQTPERFRMIHGLRRRRDERRTRRESKKSE